MNKKRTLSCAALKKGPKIDAFILGFFPNTTPPTRIKGKIIKVENDRESKSKILFSLEELQDQRSFRNHMVQEIVCLPSGVKYLFSH